MICTKLDTTHALSIVIRYMASLRRAHWQAGK